MSADRARAEPAFVRFVATVVAIGGWIALGLQLILLVQSMGPAAGTWRFLSFFTILTNLFVAISSTGIAAGKSWPLTGPRSRMALASAIALVGAAYWLLLAGLWDPQGLQLVADIFLHTSQPVLFVLLWFVMRDGTLEWHDIARATIWPFAYLAYAMGRGAIDGWYAYWFLDPSQLSVGAMAGSISALVTAVGVIAALLVWLDRVRRA